jgi:hypothetical protein
MGNLNQSGQEHQRQVLDRLPADALPQHIKKEANTMISSQRFHEWQQTPMQGAIPSTPSNGDHIEIVTDALLDALDRLTFAHHLLEGTGISKTHTALFTAVCDGLNATNQAIERCSDAPDDTSVTPYDVAGAELPPIKGKIQPPQSAFDPIK